MADPRSRPATTSSRAEAEADTERAAKAARLFDIRRLIGGLFLIYGVILAILGLGESDASIAKSADININLYAGSACSSSGACFITWALWRPLGEPDERVRAGAPAAPARPAAPSRPGGAGREQGQHRAAEAAAHHAGAGRARRA